VSTGPGLPVSRRRSHIEDRALAGRRQARLQNVHLGIVGQHPALHATFPSLVETADISHPADRFEQDTIDILKRISRRPIEPTLESELLADLGFDSLQVLELVGELEEHFNIAVPLNDLSRIRTVSQIVAEVRGLAAAAAEGRPQ